MDEPERKLSRGGLIAALVVVAALILYPLSVGPAEWAGDHGYMSADALRIAYWPLWWLSGNCKPVWRAINWYGHLWSDAVLQYTDPSDSDSGEVVFSGSGRE